MALVQLPDVLCSSVAGFLSAQELASFSTTCAVMRKAANDSARLSLKQLKTKVTLPNKLENNFFQTLASPISLLNKLTSNHMCALGGVLSSTDCVELFSSKESGVNFNSNVSSSLSCDRDECKAVNFKGTVLAFSDKSFDVFNPFTNSWQTGGSIPLKDRASICSSEDTVYIIGGLEADGTTSSSSVELLTLHPTKGWQLRSSQTLSLGTSRYGHSSVVFDGHIWVAGGIDGAEKLSSVEILPLEGDLITVDYAGDACMMVHPRSSFKLVVVNDDLFAVGGDEGCTIEKFDRVAGEWHEVTAFPSFRRNFVVGVWENGIYVMGGQGRRQNLLQNGEYYDVVRDSWTSCGFGFAMIQGDLINVPALSV